MNKKIGILFLILLMVAGFSGIAEAQLTIIGTATYEGNDYNLIYEEAQELIWLDYSSRGNRWGTQVQWAEGLNKPGVLSLNLKPGVSISWEGEWRLPATKDGARTHGYDGSTTAGFNITTSEMGHLYYVSLENKGYFDTDGNPGSGWYPDSKWGFHNTGPFENLQNDMYWSGTEYAINPPHAWSFNFPFGDQGNIAFKCSYPYMGIAVRSGKVTER
jgi:hypothetical protein